MPPVHSCVEDWTGRTPTVPGTSDGTGPSHSYTPLSSSSETEAAVRIASSSTERVMRGFTSCESRGDRDTSDELTLTITVWLGGGHNVGEKLRMLTCGFSEVVNTCEMTVLMAACEGCREVQAEHIQTP